MKAINLPEGSAISIRILADSNLGAARYDTLSGILVRIIRTENQEQCAIELRPFTDEEATRISKDFTERLKASNPLDDTNTQNFDDLGKLLFKPDILYPVIVDMDPIKQIIIYDKK